jgi:hypothetical protein
VNIRHAAQQRAFAIMQSTDGMLQLITPYAGEYAIKIVSADGRIVLAENFIGNQSVYRLDNTAMLANGLYVVRVSHGSGKLKKMWLKVGK